MSVSSLNPVSDRMMVRFGLVSAISLVLGVMTAYAQGWLPQQMGSLANSAGPWALTAFALALLATSGRLAAVFSSSALLGLLAGYVVGAEMQGYPSSRTTLLFWGVTALFVGPLLGLSAFWVKTGRGSPAAVGIGVVSGLLIGEGIYGLTRIADTTYPPYWWCVIVVGVVILLAVAWGRLSGVRPVALAVGVTAVVALAFLFIYSWGPSASLG